MHGGPAGDHNTMLLDARYRDPRQTRIYNYDALVLPGSLLVFIEWWCGLCFRPLGGGGRGVCRPPLCSALSTIAHHVCCCF